MSIGEQLHLLIELSVLRDVLTSGFRASRCLRTDDYFILCVRIWP